MPFIKKQFYNISDLINIVALLRAPGGCPWDIEQTHASIKMNLLEEAYEAADAINLNDMPHLREELGDLLLQIVLHAQMEAEQNVFDFDAVCDEICKKLIYRHPHVFGQAEVSSSGEVLQNWEKLKRAEKDRNTLQADIADVPLNFPALVRTAKLQKRAAAHGMEVGDISDAVAALKAEITELEEALAKSKESQTEELGDVLFAAVNVARQLKIDAEDALTQSSDKFVKRAVLFSTRAEEMGGIKNLSKAQQDKLWQEVKTVFAVEKP